ncbi:DUF6153 family protein [Nocardia gipuzkoensis]|uniref:DUF6153 family protein n=1 Tax=Nocardia gipuzkoensis TaxID=2749991 RepID=UPI001E5436C9|nr:DUF6153 family protein [Nocardia gipuzkoensis]UGT67941.1 DUF6153 family protein [Nocardia gipuzkoensis]
MSGQQLPPRATGSARLLGLLILLSGIAAMHVGVFSAGHGEHRLATEHTTVMATTTGAHHDGAASGASEHHALTHKAMHACVFILSAVSLAIGLVLLSWAGVDLRTAHLPEPGHRRTHRERPPPWTMPSLAELSILRI